MTSMWRMIRPMTPDPKHRDVHVLVGRPDAGGCALFVDSTGVVVRLFVNDFVEARLDRT